MVVLFVIKKVFAIEKKIIHIAWIDDHILDGWF